MENFFLKKLNFPVSTDSLSTYKISQVLILIAKLNTTDFLFDSNKCMKEFPWDKVICFGKQKPVCLEHECHAFSWAALPQPCGSRGWSQAQLWSVPMLPPKLLCTQLLLEWGHSETPGRAGLSQAHLQPLRARHLSLLPRRSALADQGCAVRVRDFQRHTFFHRHLTNCVPPRICLLHQHMVYLSHARYRWDPASVQLSNQCKTNHANNLYLRHRSHWAKVPTSLHQLSSKSHQVPMFMSGENQMQ